MLFMLFLGTQCALVAQRYTISGKVVDQDTREPLPGATIKIENSSKGTTTNLNGEFIIKSIPREKINISISYIGYNRQTIVHDFGQKSDPYLEIKLKPASTEIDQVEVMANTKGQVKAMLDQKRAINIKNIVSSEQLEQFPDLNAAEAMQRIPGITLQRDQGEGKYVQLRGTPPELTNFNINGEQIPSPEGDVRYVGMDIISADQIESIEISKVLTPDMDADGIGGTVNIITKKAKGEKPEITASSAAGYSNLRKSNNYQLQFSYGQRYNKFGFTMNSSYYQNNQGADNLEYDYAKGPFWGSTSEGVENYHVQYREVQLRHYNITRERIGLSATLDYEFNEKSNIYLRGMYNRFSDDETRRRLIYSLDDAINFQYYLYGDVERDIKDRVKNQEVNTLNLGGEHDFDFIIVDYEAAFAIAKEDQPDRLEALFDSPGHGINIKFNLDNPDWPRATFPEETGYNHANNFEEYDLDDVLFEKSHIIDRNNTYKLNLKIPYDFGTNSGFVKFGGKTRIKKKTRDIQAQQYGAYYSRSLLYPDSTAQLSLIEMNDGFEETNLLNQGYILDYMPSPDRLRKFYEEAPHHFIYDRSSTLTNSFGEDYTARENIYALYGMMKHDINDLMVLGGIRYERTDINYEGVKILNNHAGNYIGKETLKDKRIHEFFLPQFQAKYSINADFNLRAGLTYTYSRPNFEDVLPYRDEDRDKVKYGNPDLKFPRSTNIDFLGERYLKKAGVLSGGLFYKKIEDFIFYYKRFAHEGTDFSAYDLMEIEKAENGIEAFVYGAEIQVQSKFYFFKGFVRDFGVFANYTFTHSEAMINKRLPANSFNSVVAFGVDSLDTFSSSEEIETIPLPGQAKHTTNLAIFYDSKKIYAKLTAHYHDDFLHKLGADKDLDEYYDKSWHLDFTTNVSITRKLKLFTDVKNLTNQPLKYYLGTPDILQKQEFYSWWFRAGIRFKL